MIPVIDCSKGIAEAGPEIVKAIESVGFVYLKHFGIDTSTVDKVLAVSDEFWRLDLDVKNKYARPTAYDKGNTGYVAPGVEMLDPTNKAEIREAYNVTPKDGLFLTFPDEELPEFRSTVLDFYERCWQVAREVLHTLAVELKLPDVDVFEKTHSHAGTGNNATTLRLLHYPPLPEQIAPGTVRCGEHSDYGTITLLFQDAIGGLEVKGRDGAFVPANPEPGAVLINAGDLLQRWTDDRILAVKHRVLVPEDRGRWMDERRSLAFFVHPNDDAVVQPLNGAHTYAPITAKQHLLNMFSKTY